MRFEPTGTGYYCRLHDFNIYFFLEIGPERERFEQGLVDSGVYLPLPHRCAWARSQSTTRSWFVGVQDEQERFCAGFALEVSQSRVLPGHLLLRCERFGPSVTDKAREAEMKIPYGKR